MSGYVRIHRSLIGHPAFRNDAEAMAFAWLICRAAWRQTRVRYKDRAITLLRGQVAISVRDFANAMDRDKAWIERLLKRLKSEAMVETRNETGVSVITIRNYDEFQAEQDTRETASETDARQAQDTEQRIEEGKKERDDAEASSSAEPRLAAVAWNDLTPQTGWPSIKSISDKRRRALKAILRQHGLDGWRAALTRAAASPLLGGRPPPTWFTFDWIVKPANFLKLIEGNYDRAWQSASEPGVGKTVAARDAVIAKLRAGHSARAAAACGPGNDLRPAYPGSGTGGGFWHDPG